MNPIQSIDFLTLTGASKGAKRIGGNHVQSPTANPINKTQGLAERVGNINCELTPKMDDADHRTLAFA